MVCLASSATLNGHVRIMNEIVAIALMLTATAFADPVPYYQVPGTVAKAWSPDTNQVQHALLAVEQYCRTELSDTVRSAREAEARAEVQVTESNGSIVVSYDRPQIDTNALPDVLATVPAAVAASLPDRIKQVRPGMAVNQAVDALGLLHCGCRVLGHGYEANYGVHLIYSLPGDRTATVLLRVDRTRSLTNGVPRRPWRDEVWDSFANCPVKTCELTMEPQEQPNEVPGDTARKFSDPQR